jgi:extracellular factor (EF) 3-hydroxypalmitic acid methyl ester biosynthesis protein
MEQDIRFIRGLVDKGGLDSEDYPVFERWLDGLAERRAQGDLPPEALATLRTAFGEALSPKTMQGFGYSKPHGYPGDFEMIDRIYLQFVSEEAHLRKWDEYFHSTLAAKAVRNRKTYFLHLLEALQAQRAESAQTKCRVLDVASGPCRDLYEYFAARQSSGLQVDCVEFDQKAIAFASSLCEHFLGNIGFRHANALKFRTPTKYRLIWSGGLFDYFSDAIFRALLVRYAGMLDPDGELVVGNFSDANPTRNYMEVIGDWPLQHRSAKHLEALALECGFPASSIRVEAEPLRVNLFLHVRSGGDGGGGKSTATRA